MAEFIAGWEALQQGILRGMDERVYQVNVANGWFDEDRTVGDDVALLHSEVSEMFEAWREHGLADATKPLRNSYTGEIDPSKLPKPEGFGSEAADILIRLLDTCHRRGVDLSAEFNRKVAYNATRGYKHGGKKI